MSFKHKVLFDTRLSKYVVENDGFTKEGYQFEDLFYIPYRFNKHEEIKILITKTPPAFFNSKVFKRMITKEEYLLKDKE